MVSPSMVPYYISNNIADWSGDHGRMNVVTKGVVDGSNCRSHYSNSKTAAM